jgi:hypothetical protein
LLQLLSYTGKLALVSYETLEKDWPEITDWNVKLGQFSMQRRAWIGVPGWSEERLRNYIRSHSLACIYNIVAHNPIMVAGDREQDIPLLVQAQQIVMDGVPYVDFFGMHVYITSRVAWEQRSDVDIRFTSNMYPYQHLVPEVGFLDNLYDLFSRQRDSTVQRKLAAEELPGV